MINADNQSINCFLEIFIIFILKLKLFLTSDVKKKPPMQIAAPEEKLIIENHYFFFGLQNLLFPTA